MADAEGQVVGLIPVAMSVGIANQAMKMTQPKTTNFSRSKPKRRRR